MNLELDFGGAGSAVAPAGREVIPESFHQIFEDKVINYGRAEGQSVGLGSYLIIYRDNSSVATRVQPLIEWRQRQGYNVIVADTGDTGTTTTSIKNTSRASTTRSTEPSPI